MNETDTVGFEHTLTYLGALARASYVIAIAYKLKLSEHSGTHIDAPVHFSEGKPTVDEILPEDLIDQAIVINITEQAFEKIPTMKYLLMTSKTGRSKWCDS
ncbi:cyclase family [Paramuricea clavata]|uniref:Cyclase family n=1 Tax=Paramuricea clavata TaxID=317549 RepID=A0A6S7H244_PARCT|nr:cyclase family [Paramuricea clavata]